MSANTIDAQVITQSGKGLRCKKTTCQCKKESVGMWQRAVWCARWWPGPQRWQGGAGKAACAAERTRAARGCGGAAMAGQLGG